jgi:hypothetical protein
MSHIGLCDDRYQAAGWGGGGWGLGVRDWGEQRGFEPGAVRGPGGVEELGRLVEARLLASVRQDTLLLVELGLLLPLVHLSPGITWAGMQRTGWWTLFIEGEIERVRRSW